MDDALSGPIQRNCESVTIRPQQSSPRSAKSSFDVFLRRGVAARLSNLSHTHAKKTYMMKSELFRGAGAATRRSIPSTSSSRPRRLCRRLVTDSNCVARP